MNSIEGDNLNFILISVIPEYLKKSELPAYSHVSRGHYLAFKRSQGLLSQDREFAVMELAFRGLALSTYPEGRINLYRLQCRFLEHPVLEIGPGMDIELGGYTIEIETFTRGRQYSSYLNLIREVVEVIFPLLCGLTTTFATEFMMQEQGVWSNLILTSLFLIPQMVNNFCFHQPSLYTRIEKIFLQLLTSTVLIQGFSRLNQCYPIDDSAKVVAVAQTVLSVFGMNNGYLFTGIVLMGRCSDFSNTACYNGGLMTLASENIPWSIPVESAYRKIVGPSLSASITLPIRARYAKAQIKKHKLSTAIDVIGTSAILMAVGLSTGPAIIGGMGIAGIAKSGGTSVLGFAARKVRQIPSAFHQLIGNILFRFIHIM